MERLNEMIRKLPPEDHNGFKPIELFVLRPSRDLGKLAGEYEKNLPRSMKIFTRALGSRETESPAFMSLMMFEPNYTRALIELGERDVETRLDELKAFLGLSLKPVLSAV